MPIISLFLRKNLMAKKWFIHQRIEDIDFIAGKTSNSMDLLLSKIVNKLSTLKDQFPEIIGIGGGIKSISKTKVQVAVLLFISVTITVMVCIPSAKSVPIKGD